MFTLYRGKAPLIEWRAKVASTLMSAGGLTVPTGSGTETPATSGAATVTGVSLREVTSADSDFATTAFFPICIPTDDTEFLATVGTGTLTTAMIGNECDLKDAVSIDVNASAEKVVVITGFVSSTVAIVKLKTLI